MVSISIPRRLPIALLFTSAILVESCNDALFHAPAPAAAAVHMTASMSRMGGGARAAFDRADRMFVRFRAGDDVRLERELPFTPPAVEVVVRFDVPLRQLTEEVSAEVELRLGDGPLFRGITSGTLSAGTPTPMDVPLDPVVAVITCGTGLVQLSAYGRTAQLVSDARFASGDPILPSDVDVPVTWSTPANGAVSVSETGVVTALQDGDAAVTCSASGVSATRQVRVFAVARSARVAPASATIVAGTLLELVATLFDSLGNLIPTPRTVTFRSTNPTVATVSPTGIVTGVTVGSTRIVAASGAAVDSSTLAVVVPSTAVTIASTQVTGNGATLLGSVNPRGVATQAWFEWGTDPALAAPAVTATRAVGSANTDVSVSAALSTLVPNTTYYFRTVASSAGGAVRGATLSFRTPALPSVTTIGLDAAAQLYTVRGSVTPNGNAAVTWFEYGTSPLLASFAQTAKQSIGSGSSAVSVTQALSGLQPSTTYSVRIVASNIGGTASGAITSFTTGALPTLEAPKVTLRTVSTLSSRVNPNGVTAIVWFEYSTSSAFASLSKTNPDTIPSGTTLVPFSADLCLKAQTYYYRAVGSNKFGTIRSSTEKFTTMGCVE
jgi:hypothetical protein